MFVYNTRDIRYIWTRRVRIAGLGMCLLWAQWLPVPARAEAVAGAKGSLMFEITSTTVPANLTLNPGGTSPSNSLFPDFGNSGAGSLTGMGDANCTPAGCTDPKPNVDLEIQISNDLTCTSNPDGTYGGLEDSFALFGGNNTSGGSLSLDLRFTTSWSVSSTITDPGNESAAASIDILWAIPTDFCIELTSCASGSLSGGFLGSCPAGSLTGTTLVLGSADVDTTMGNDSDAGPLSTCDVTVTVLQGATSGGDMSVTSSCSSDASVGTSIEDGTLSIPPILLELLL